MYIKEKKNHRNKMNELGVRYSGSDCNPNTGETEAGLLKFEASLCYRRSGRAGCQHVTISL